MSKLSYLLTLTPRETWRIARQKIPVLRSGAPWTPHELMSSAKHTRGIRFAELLLRQEAVVARHMPWQPLNFEGKSVVEIGCGPLGGFAPLAIFCGAEKFESAEPEWDPNLLFSNIVVEKYLRIFHADLVALFGERLGFSEFLSALKKRLVVTRDGFQSATISGPVDIVLSQSVLEHVFPLDQTMDKLASIHGPKTQSLHLVDFGNHYPTTNPFEGLYEQSADSYISKRGKAINCLRMADIHQQFADRSLNVEAIPTRYVKDSYDGRISSWWTDRYGDRDLFTQLCIYAGPGNAQ